MLKQLLGLSLGDDENQELPIFLYGESMGGSVCLRANRLRPDSFRGILLHSPLCGIKDEWLPSTLALHTGKALSQLAPTAPLLAGDESGGTTWGLKDPRKLASVLNSPPRYKGGMRLGTAMELYKLCKVVRADATKSRTPICIMHALEDKVTDPDKSFELFKNSSSEDKTYIGYQVLKNVLN
eukprot:gb/GECG01004941.1/.p1 GENE.gb/GECG01004941.1/~~gb/GECG01004941.1/.p1  ORF type:complete len:182 (+),score=23.42 gb/GECG01004941.1/:1-546(+)